MLLLICYSITRTNGSIRKNINIVIRKKIAVLPLGKKQFFGAIFMSQVIFIIRDDVIIHCQLNKICFSFLSDPGNFYDDFYSVFNGCSRFWIFDGTQDKLTQLPFILYCSYMTLLFRSSFSFNKIIFFAKTSIPII